MPRQLTFDEQPPDRYMEPVIAQDLRIGDVVAFPDGEVERIISAYRLRTFTRRGLVVVVRFERADGHPSPLAAGLWWFSPTETVGQLIGCGLGPRVAPEPTRGRARRLDDETDLT
jgi:hypothetical protein